MPAAFLFQSGRRCGPEEACSTLFWRNCGIGLVHVADNDRYVLEPAIVTARINGNRTTFRGKILSEFDKSLRPASFVPLAFAIRTHLRDARTSPATSMSDTFSNVRTLE